MERNEIMEKVTSVFRDVFDDEELVITDSTTAADIEDWDSLTHITLISAIEDELGYKFGMKEVLGLKNVGEMIDLLETKLWTTTHTTK